MTDLTEKQRVSIRIFSLRLLLALAVSTSVLGMALPTTVANAEEATIAPEHASEVAIFYYPWYATPEHDGHWAHWDQNGRTPPESLGANFSPLNGAYSSADIGVIESQMQQIAAAGIDTIVTSWWGQGSYEDTVLSALIAPAAQLHLKIAAHIEPYKGRSDRTLRSDYEYLRNKGIREFYIYQTQQLTTAGVGAVSDLASDDRFYGETANESAVRNGDFMQWAQDAHFDGIYTYDPRGFSPDDFAGICGSAHAHNLFCMPSVGPGWDGTRATKIPGVVSRKNGETYDRYWQAAIAAHADIVTITSFNEWHEGTQIEPAGTQCIPSENYCYSNYEGTYGKRATEAAYAYLARTLYWSIEAKGHAPTLTERLSIVSNALRRNDAAAVMRFRDMQVRNETSISQ